MVQPINNILQHGSQYQTIFIYQKNHSNSSSIDLLRVHMLSHTQNFSKNVTILYEKNEKFFISLPFKKNEDINPTKTSHLGMNLKHQQMAKKECEELRQQGLLEDTRSPQACHAFYVNKRIEQTKGKQRLVINYQPLNHFLADNKFSLSNRNSLYSSLSQAKNIFKT